jgi:hypothetical protein
MPTAGKDGKARIMRDAIEALVGAAEEAKGTLRGLRELLETGPEQE